MASESAAVVFALEHLGRFQERSAEEARAAARDINRRFDRFEDAVGKRFDGLDQRVADICDFRRQEHGEFRAGIDALTDRLDAKDAEARGRAQVFGAFGKAAKFAVDNAWIIITLGLGVWTVADDIIPAVAAATQPPAVAALEQIGPGRAVAAIPSADSSLRGTQD